MKASTATLSGKDRLALVSNLATMLSSGIPIIEAIDSMLEESKGNLRRILQVLRQDLSEGRTMSWSLSRAPKAFDPVMVNLIKAAEEAGTLDTTLKDMVVTIKRDLEFSSNVKGAMAYPVFIGVVFWGVLIVILTFVMPRISKVFMSLRVQLPTPTKVLIASSNFLMANWLYLLVGLVVATIIVAVLFRANKRAVLGAVLSLPLLRRLGRQLDLVRLTRSMSLLLRSGIPILEAIELSRHVVVKREILTVLDRAMVAVNSGRPMSDGFRGNNHVIPGMMLRIVEAGERSGSLEKSMGELADFFETEVNNTLKATTTLIEPVMLVVIGVMVGGMMMSIIAPIYNLIGQVSSAH